MKIHQYFRIHHTEWRTQRLNTIVYISVIQIIKWLSWGSLVVIVDFFPLAYNHPFNVTIYEGETHLMHLWNTHTQCSSWRLSFKYFCPNNLSPSYNAIRVINQMLRELLASNLTILLKLEIEFTKNTILLRKWHMNFLNARKFNFIQSTT